MLTLKPPAVPALMIKSGCNACTAAYVTRADDIVPTLSTPERNRSEPCQMKTSSQTKIAAFLMFLEDMKWGHVTVIPTNIQTTSDVTQSGNIVQTSLKGQRSCFYISS